MFREARKPRPRTRRGPDPARQGHLPGRSLSREFNINQARLTATAIAASVVAWLLLLALTSDLAKSEPKALRYRLLHVPARLVHSG